MMTLLNTFSKNKFLEGFQNAMKFKVQLAKKFTACYEELGYIVILTEHELHKSDIDTST